MVKHHVSVSQRRLPANHSTIDYNVRVGKVYLSGGSRQTIAPWVAQPLLAVVYLSGGSRQTIANISTSTAPGKCISAAAPGKP